MRLAKTLMKTATGLHNLLCVLPLLCVANLYALIGRAASLLDYWPAGYHCAKNAVPLGYWPTYYCGNDAVTVDQVGSGDWLYQALFHGMEWLVCTAVLSIPLWLVFTICLRGRYSLAGRWSRAALLGLGWLACIAVVAFDPGRCFAWFMA